MPQYNRLHPVIQQTAKELTGKFIGKMPSIPRYPLFHGEDAADEDVSGEDAAGEDVSDEDAAGEDIPDKGTSGVENSNVEIPDGKISNKDVPDEDISAKKYSGEDISNGNNSEEHISGESISGGTNVGESAVNDHGDGQLSLFEIYLGPYGEDGIGGDQILRPETEQETETPGYMPFPVGSRIAYDSRIFEEIGRAHV